MKNRTFRILSTFSAMAFALVASAQFPDMETSTQPWQELKIDQKKRVKLNFVQSSVEMVVRFFGTNSGVTIVKDPKLTGPINLSTAKAVSLDEAFGVFAAVLDLKGYQIVRQSNFLIIKEKPKAPAGRGIGGTPPMFQAPGGFGGGRTATNELRTYRLEFASASAVAKTINDVFSTSSSPTFGGFPTGGPGSGGFPGGPGGGGPGGGGLGGGGFPGGGGALEQGGGRGPGAGGPMGGARGQATPTQSSVKASSDDYSNTVIVNASASLQLQVSELIRKIDVNVKQPLTTKMYSLTFASAADVTATLQSVLTANAPKGRGASSQSQSPIEQRFMSPFASNSSSSSNGTVTYEARSNSVIVTTTEENHAVVLDLINGLDKEFASADATAVVSLANARASDMASLLGQAFGSRSGSRVTTNNNTGRSTTTSGGRTNTGGQPGQGGLGGGQTLDSSNLYAQLRNPDSDSGELAMSFAVQQGFPQFGGGQGSGTQQRSSATVSRNAQGQVVNTSDLTGRVTVVADPNTNSLIIVGDPDAVARIQAILEQLDRIPQQVVIETMIVEASLDSESKLGVEWSFAQAKAFGSTGVSGTAGANFGLESATNQGFNYTLKGGNLAAYLNAFKSDSRFQVLSTPRIFTSNNVEATINISQSIPYIISQREDANGNLTYNYDFQDVGIVLTVTPQISPSGTVTLDVTQTANELQGYTDFNAPIINQREATTTVSVKNGDTVVLGGIMRKTVSATTKKIPILGDLPLLGQLFRSTSKSDSKTELLVFLTPRIVLNPEDAKADADRQKKELSPESRKKIGG